MIKSLSKVTYYMVILLVVVSCHEKENDPPIIPAGPILLSPANNETGIQNDTTFSWGPFTNATGYHLQLSTSEDFSNNLIDAPNITTLSYDVSSLKSGTVFYWRVSANSNLGPSAWSDVWNFKVNTIPTNGMLAYYPFNGNADDASGNLHHGVVFGASPSQDRNGTENHAYSFNGVDDYISVDDTEQVLNLINNFTISVWYNSDGCITACDPPAYHTIIMKRDVSVGPGDDWPWGLSISYIPGGSGNEFRKLYNTRRTGGTADYLWSSSEIELNVWQHAVVTVADNIQSIYLDGVLDTTSSFTLAQNPSSKSLNIGWSLRPDMEQFKGKIDDIRIYDRALTAKEVRVLLLE